MTSSINVEEQKIRVRWLLVVIFSSTGAAVILIGFLTTLYAAKGDDVAAFWVSVCVNVGTSLLLAAILVWFERSLLVRVQKQGQLTVQAATAAATATATQLLTAGLGDVQLKLQHLDDRLNDRQTATRGQRVDKASSIAERVSRDSVTEALKTAVGIGALDINVYRGESRLIIPAGASALAPRIQISWDAVFAADETLDGGGETVLGSILNLDETSITWDAAQDAAEVFNQLSEEMIRIGLGREARDLSAESFFSNLSSSLVDIIKARQAEPEAWLSGAVAIELIRDGIMLTHNGVEFRDLPLFLFMTEFTSSKLPAKPAGLDAETWTVVVERAQAHYRIL